MRHLGVAALCGAAVLMAACGPGPADRATTSTPTSSPVRPRPPTTPPPVPPTTSAPPGLAKARLACTRWRALDADVTARRATDGVQVLGRLADVSSAATAAAEADPSWSHLADSAGTLTEDYRRGRSIDADVARLRDDCAAVS